MVTVIIGVGAQCAIAFLNVLISRFFSHRGAITPICAMTPIPVCAESQLNQLVLRSYRTGLCDNSDMCGSEKIKAIITWGVWNAHPVCEDSDMCDSNQITPDIAALAADGIIAAERVWCETVGKDWH